MEKTNKSEQRRWNEIVNQYKPLINKIVFQYMRRNPGIEHDAITSMAYEGLAIAFSNYNESRSKMTFVQYAAFAIRNNILTSLDNETRTVKLSNYAQKKTLERGQSLFNTMSIDNAMVCKDGENPKIKETLLNISVDEDFSEGDVMARIYDKLEKKFPRRDCEFFYKTFGLNGFDESKGKDIAMEYSVSEGLISQKLKKIITFIRGDREMMDIMESLRS